MSHNGPRDRRDGTGRTRFPRTDACGGAMVRMSKFNDRMRLSTYAAEPHTDGIHTTHTAGARTAGLHAAGAHAAGFYTEPRGRVWSGAGGRWLLWPLRAVLWAAVLI